MFFLLLCRLLYYRLVACPLQRQQYNSSQNSTCNNATPAHIIMSGIWAAYNKALAANPLLVKAMTSFTGFTVGDILAQKFISPDDSYDFARTLRLGVCVCSRACVR